MALRNAGLQMSLGRNAADAKSYGKVDSANYGTRNEALESYEPNYDLPEESPWEALQDAHGNTYYSNTLTGQTSWEPPAGFQKLEDTLEK